jgi:hypothetical protein
MPLADIVNVVVTKASSSVSRTGFGTILIAAYHTENTDRVTTYSASTALATMVADGFDTTSPAYLAMAAVLSQNPRVKTIKIGRRDQTWTQVVDLVPVEANLAVYDGYVNDLPWTFTADGTATLAEVCTGIAAAITALAGVTATGASGTKVVITADAAATLFNVAPGAGAGVYSFSDVTVDTGVATDLNTIRAADSDWYGLVLDMTSEPAIKAAAAWAETQLVVYGCNSADSGILLSATTTDVLSDLQDSNYVRTLAFYHQDYDSFAGAAALGGGFPYEPGAYDYFAKTLRGVTVSSLSPTQQDAVTDKAGNIFVATGGKNVVLYGTTPSGEFLDDTISIDWIQSRVTEEVWSLLSSAPKLPYTDESVDRLRGAVLGVLLLGVRRGVLANDPSPTVDAPRVSEVSETDRANRHLPDVVGTGRLAGGIHSVDVSITVSV